jgi:hypothetical protein
MNIIKSIYSGIKASVFLLGVFSLSSCLENGDETIILETETVLGIPSDDKADPNPVISNPNADIPNIQYITEKIDGQYVMRIDMTGIQDPNTKEWLKLFGISSNEESSQNIWVSVDNKPKGFIVKNTIDNEDNNRRVMNDIVFLVDNSGSMSEEANAIARDIISWAQKLSSTLDVKFGCVGYDGRITGAINLTSYNAMSEYLNRSTGTSRTVGFSGTDAEKLEYAASSYANSYNECGTAALRFADEQFTFRNGANRIYINFTDEPNQPNGQEGFSVLFVNDQNNWNTSQGTIHTVFSGNKNFTESFYYNEYPWRMSDYTGGTTLYASSSFTGVTLDDLPVTGALQNSYVIYFTNIKEFMDGQVHQVKITVLSEDGTVRGEKIFYVIFGEKKDTDDNDSEENISKNKLIGEWEIESDLFEVYKNGKLIERYMEEGGELEIFNSNGIYIYDNGDTGKWTLSSNKLTIKYLVEEDDTEVWTITKLTSSEMVRELQESEDGYVYKYKVTSRKL